MHQSSGFEKNLSEFQDQENFNGLYALHDLYGMTLPTGDTVNGIPIVCTDSCYVYSKEWGNWGKIIQTISNKVYHASSISLSNALFVTGGYEPISKVNVNTTNLVFTNGTIKNGPNMPEGLRQHCMASMYDGTVVAIIGGKYRLFFFRSIPQFLHKFPLILLSIHKLNRLV